MILAQKDYDTLNNLLGQSKVLYDSKCGCDKRSKMYLASFRMTLEDIVNKTTDEDLKNFIITLMNEFERIRKAKGKKKAFNRIYEILVAFIDSSSIEEVIIETEVKTSKKTNKKKAESNTKVEETVVEAVDDIEKSLQIETEEITETK